MKIDLHCHTKSIKKGDPKTRDVTSKKFKDAVNNIGVKIVGISNHNSFDMMQYEEFIKIVDGDFMIWPGIELDVLGLDKESGHAVIINNPKKVKDFVSELNKTIGSTSPDDFKISINSLIKLVNNLDCIIMLHYFRPKQLNDKSIEKIREGIQDKYRLFYEPATYRSLGILINHNKHSLIGSDVKDWNKYHEYEFADLKLDVDSFEQFIMLAKKDILSVNTLFQKLNSSSIDIGYKNIKENVIFFDDVNIFFGTKGTGKTVSLNKVLRYYKNKGKDVAYYVPKENDDKIDSKLKVLDDERLLASYNKDDCKKEFKNISSWSDKNVTQFKDYYNYFKNKNVNSNKEKMKILEITTINQTQTEIIVNIKADYDSLLEVKKNINNIDLSKYFEKENIIKLNIILQDLEKSIVKKMEESWDEYYAIKLSNRTVEMYKNIVEAKTELKTVPSNSGFIDYVSNRFKLQKNIDKIESGFLYNFTNTSELVGNLEEGKELNKVVSISMLNKNSLTDEFTHGIKTLKNLKKQLNEVKDNLYTINVSESLTTLNDELLINKIISLDPFLGVIKKFQIKGLDYKPSTGEATMIVLDETLIDNHDVYILDEPEKSLGNTYISDVLVPKINNLAKLKKTIIVATHNANIAVRTFPLRSILKEYKDSTYSTYVGSPFINKLLKINNSDDIKDWKAESIRILEGGKEAFEERGEIYGEK